MATERQLRNRMRQLEEELARQESRQNDLRRQIAAQTQQQIERMQRDAEEVFRRKMNETAEAYAQRVRQFQEEILRQNEQQMQTLRREAELISQQTRQTLKELEACNRELQDELKKLREDAAQQEATGRQFAAEAQEKARQAQQQASKTPHTFFCPQEFDIISEHIQDIEPLIKQGMYQAAISDAGCIALEFELLRTKVEQAFSEWMQAFEDYRMIVGSLRAQIKTFEERQLQTCIGSFRMDPAELNFWSCGSYAPMVKTITEAYDTFCEMDQQQVMDYLRSSAGTNRRAIYDLVIQGKKWQDQLTAIMNCITSERLFSDERVSVADEVVALMEERNCLEEINRFQPPLPQTAAQDWYIAPADEDPLNSRNVQILMGRNNRIKLRLVPRRENGLAVANVIFLSVDLYSSSDTKTELLVAADARGSIEKMLQEQNLDISVRFVPSEVNSEQTIAGQERLISPPPSTSAQIRYLERKYH